MFHSPLGFLRGKRRFSPDWISEARQRLRGNLYYGWVLMGVLGMTTIIPYGTMDYLFGVLVIPLTASFHWSRASLSGTYALGLILSGILGVPVGYAVDRWGHAG